MAGLVAELGVHAAYAGMILLGLALMVMIRPMSAYAPAQRRAYLRIQIMTLIGAVIGSKFAVVIGDGLWPLYPVEQWRDLIFSGRSIIGALLGGYLTAEVLKPMLGYTLPPNDRFAVILPFSIATGRLGCWMTGCCQGVVSDGWCAVVGQDGIARVPAPLIECLFHVLCGIAFLIAWRSAKGSGRLFLYFLFSYGWFRLLSEFWRDTAKPFAGWSGYQWMSLLAVFIASAALYLRRSTTMVHAAQVGQEPR